MSIYEVYFVIVGYLMLYHITYYSCYIYIYISISMSLSLSLSIYIYIYIHTPIIAQLRATLSVVWVLMAWALRVPWSHPHPIAATPKVSF